MHNRQKQRRDVNQRGGGGGGREKTCPTYKRNRVNKNRRINVYARNIKCIRRIMLGSIIYAAVIN